MLAVTESPSEPQFTGLKAKYVEKLPFATDAAASPSPAHPIPVTSIYIISVLHASADPELAATRGGKPK